MPRPDDLPTLGNLRAVPTYRDSPATIPSDLVGVDPDGRRVEITVVGSGRWTLLVFLSTDCLGCLPIWDALVDPVAAGLSTDEVVVAVTKGPPAGDLTVLARARGARVVMSTAAWAAYRVHGPPFYVLVDGRPEGSASATTEGVAWGVEQISADIGRARGQAS